MNLIVKCYPKFKQ